MKFQIPADATYMDVLKAIDGWADELIHNGAASHSENEGHKLWAVLTALRGDDLENGAQKMRYTEPIRGYVLPSLAILGGGMYHVPGNPVQMFTKILDQLEEQFTELYRHTDVSQAAQAQRLSTHYMGHIKWAAEHLLAHATLMQDAPAQPGDPYVEP